MTGCSARPLAGRRALPERWRDEALPDLATRAVVRRDRLGAEAAGGPILEPTPPLVGVAEASR